MKRVVFLFVLFFSVVSCQVSTEPEFRGIQNVYATEISLPNVEVESEALFYNPNHVGCIVKNVDIILYVNGVSVGKAIQKHDVIIESRGEFSVPLVSNFAPLELLVHNLDLLNGSLNKLLTNEIELQYKGNITLEKLGLSYTFEIEKTKLIDLSKKIDNEL